MDALTDALTVQLRLAPVGVPSGHAEAASLLLGWIAGWIAIAVQDGC
jgi:hypothetical protein